MRSRPRRLLALGLWVLGVCWIPSAAAAAERVVTAAPERWKNDFSLEIESIASVEMGTGLSASWFFLPFLGAGVQVTRVAKAPLGGAFAAIRWHGTGGFFLGAQTGPQFGDFLLLGDEDEVTMTGLFWNGALFAGFRFGSGAQVGLKWAATIPVVTEDGWKLGEAASQMVIAVFGFSFMGTGSGIAVEPQETTSLFMKWIETRPRSEDLSTTDLAPRHRLFSLAAGLGTGTPAGHFFVEAGFSPLRSVDMAFGLGRGSEGAAESFTLRYRSLGALGLNHLFLGAGISHETLGEKPFRQNHPEHRESFVLEDAWFFNVETGYGWVHSDGFMGRLTFGLTTLLNPAEGTCVENCTVNTASGPVPTRETANFNRVTPYLSLTLGFAF